MKKVLFATTALVAFAGAAAAQNVTVSGSAEMGFASNDARTIGNFDGQRKTGFYQSIDLDFTMVGETDNGLAFGASIDLADAIDEANRNSNITDDFGEFADYTIFISGQFGTLTMGDTDGAIDFNIVDAGNIGNPGSIADDETAHAGYNGFGGELDSASIYNGQNLRYDYGIAGFNISVSAQIDGDPQRGGDPALQIGVSYELDFAGGTVDLGAGYGSLTDANRVVGFPNSGPIAEALDLDFSGDQGFDIWGIGAAAFLDNGLSMGFTYASIDDTDFFGGDGEQWGIGIGYTWDAFSIAANYGEYDWDSTARLPDSSGWGVAAAYDLGGGLSMNFGYGDSQYSDQNESFGVGFNPDLGPDGQYVLDEDWSSWSFGLVMEF